MKIFIILSSLIVSSSVWAQCANKIDNSKVMLFVDSNESGPEILTAQKAACQRGQKLVVIPQNYKDYEVYKVKQEKSMAAAQACVQKNPNNTETACKPEIDAFRATMKEAQEFQQKQKPYDTQIREEMDKLKNSKGTLESFTISGHDGGGHFGGSMSGKQSYSKQEVAAIMKDYPEVNQVKSLMLLGCYTGVQQEMFDWQTIFPDVRLIGGYDGSAPLSIRPQGHDYLYDLLTKEKVLTKTADQKKLELMVKNNIRSINQLNAAIFLKPECENIHDEKSYYYSKMGEQKVLRPFDMNECLTAKNNLLELKQRLDLYDSGELEPPKDTAVGELRQIYNQSRSHEHCVEMIGPILDSNKVFGLLFYESEKKNFSNYFENEMKEVEKIIEGISPEDIIKSAEENIKVSEEILERDKADLALHEADPAAYAAKKEKEFEANKKEYEKLIQDPKLKKILEANPYLKSTDFNEFMTQNNPEPLTPEENKIFMEVLGKYNGLSTMSVDLGNIKNAPAQFIEMKKSIIKQTEDFVTGQRLSLEKIKASPDSLKNFWIPTKKNLQGKTRKETLKNIHDMHQFLSLPGIPAKGRAAISWVANAKGMHLQGLMNPFSWHEFTGTTEAPPYSYKLSDALRSAQEGGGYVGGAMGGYGMGGGFGFGGGSAGGSGRLDDSERPIH